MLVSEQPNPSTWLAIMSPRITSQARTCPPDALLLGGEIVPLRVANGKELRSAIANMHNVCKQTHIVWGEYLNGLTIGSR